MNWWPIIIVSVVGGLVGGLAAFLLQRAHHREVERIFKEFRERK